MDWTPDERFRPRYYILEGTTPRLIEEPSREEELLTWAQWMETDQRFLARDEIADGTVISTIFLGLDTSVLHLGEPVLFETVVFDAPETEDGVAPIERQWRYTSHAQAMEGHAHVVSVYCGTQKERR